MAALYPSWSNTVYRAVLLLLALIAVSAIVGPMIFVRTTYNTDQFVPLDQPVEFDHRHHVRDDGIECLYCHSSAERFASAGVPPTELCMGCHNQIWNDSPLLEPVRRSYFSGRPIPWTRVHDLPAFVYFHHGVHVQRGIACETCHGDVSLMARVAKVQPLTMTWCLNCHRRSVSGDLSSELPRSAWSATVQNFTPSFETERTVTPLTTCTACHR